MKRDNTLASLLSPEACEMPWMARSPAIDPFTQTIMHLYTYMQQLIIFDLIHLMLCACYTLFCQSNTTCNLGMKKTCHSVLKSALVLWDGRETKRQSYHHQFLAWNKVWTFCPPAGFRDGLLLTTSEKNGRRKRKACRDAA